MVFTCYFTTVLIQNHPAHSSYLTLLFNQNFVQKSCQLFFLFVLIIIIYFTFRNIIIFLLTVCDRCKEQDTINEATFELKC